MSNIDFTNKSTTVTRAASALVAAKTAVNAERDRRAGLGFTYNSVVFQSDDKSMAAIDRASTLAFVAITNGAAAGNLRWSDPNADFYWIAEDNSLVPMDAQTVLDLGKALATYKQSLIFAARTIKDISPIPDDYTDDKNWSA